MARGIDNEENNSEENKTEEDIVRTNAPEVHWTVPLDTDAVYLYELDRNGRQVTSYTISNYITMKPGHTFIIKAK